MIRGIGVDIVEVSRIERAVARWGEAFLGRVFTERERRHAGTSAGAHQAASLRGAPRAPEVSQAADACPGKCSELADSPCGFSFAAVPQAAYVLAAPGAAQRLAGRFAAKEAVMKALGLGWRSMAWREIEIATDPLGKPVVELSGRAAAAARRLGVGAWMVSISHTRRLAIAQALAE